jgi:creatinine amidohydrolase
MDEELLIERLTWPEVVAAIAGGRRRAIIAAAATEQHGPHLVEATDALIGEALALRLAARLGDALVAPVIRPGCSDHHLGFAGTISIPPEVLIAILDAYVASLRRHGFTSFFVFSSHGGNYPVLASWAPADPSGVTVLRDSAGFLGAMLAGLRRAGREDTTIPHSDASETAEMLALHPDLVRQERIVTGFVGELSLDELISRGLRNISDNGILGNPVGATAEMGDVVIDTVVEFLAKAANAS